MRLLGVLHLKLAEAVTHGLSHHQLAGSQTDREVAHVQPGLDMVGDLTDDGGAKGLQFRLEAQVYRAISGAIQSLPADLPSGTQARRGRNQKAIEDHFDRQAVAAFGTVSYTH